MVKVNSIVYFVNKNHLYKILWFLFFSIFLPRVCQVYQIPNSFRLRPTSRSDFPSKITLHSRCRSPASTWRAYSLNFHPHCKTLSTSESESESESDLETESNSNPILIQTSSGFARRQGKALSTADSIWKSKNQMYRNTSD